MLCNDNLYDIDHCARLGCGLDRWTGLLGWITGSNQTASESDDAGVALLL